MNNNSENKFQNYKNYLRLLITFGLNYSDIFTDIYLTFKFLRQGIEDDKHSSVQISFLMIYALLYERYIQYFACIDMIKILKEKMNNLQDYKLSRFEKLQGILYSITYTDCYLYFKVYRNVPEKNIFKLLFIKRIQDMCAENLVFFIFGAIYFFEQNVLQNSYDPLVVFSLFLSYLSCFLVFVQIYYRRIEKYGKYREKNLTKLNDFTVKFQLYIIDPSQLQILKFYSGYKFQQFMPCILSQQAQDKQNQKMRKSKISVVKKIYIMVFVFINSFPFMYIISIQNVSMHSIKVVHFIWIGIILHSPQIIVYIYKQLKNEQKLGYKILAIFKIIYKLPVLAINGMYTFCAPLPVYEIPFIKQTEQIWKFNFYPTIYILFVVFVQEIHLIYLIYSAIINKQHLFTEIIDNEQKIYYLSDQNHLNYKIFRVVLVLVLIDLIQKALMILYEILKYTILDKCKDKKKYKQSSILKQKNQSQQKHQDPEILSSRDLLQSNSVKSLGSSSQFYMQQSKENILRFDMKNYDFTNNIKPMDQI